MSDPTHLGRYRIVSKLGAGAMGDVFLAEDPQIDRQLAIKTVKLHGSEDEVAVRKQRMLVEARAAGRLVHPHVVTLFDAGEDGETVYLVFEYVEGQDLSVRLKSGTAILLKEALEVVRQTAQALHHAHRLGIVHRDIKPSNIMLTRDGEAKIGDFGIAKLHNQETDLTTTGMLIGTPHYMSPEQVRGETLDGRSDVFSLGSVLFELLHRRRPFPSETLTTLVYQILHEDPTEGLRDNLPPELADLLRAMLAKEVAERPDAGWVADEIARLKTAMAAEQLDHEAWTVEGVAAPEIASAPSPPPPLPAQAPPPTAVEPPPPTAASSAAPAPPPTAQAASPAPPPTAQAPSTTTSDGDATTSSGRRWLPWVAAAGCLGLVGLAAVGGGVAWLASRTGGDESAVETELAEALPEAQESGALGEDPDEASQDTLSDPESGESADDATPETAAVGPTREDAAQVPDEPAAEPVAAPTRRADRTQPPPERAPTRTASADPPTRAQPEEPLQARTEEPAAQPAGTRSPPTSAPTEDLSRLEVDRELEVSTAVGFRIKPDDAFVLFRRPGETRFTNIGRSRDYDMKRRRRGAYTLPGPGPYLVVLRREGYSDYRIRLNAVAGSEPSLIEVALSN